MYGADVLRQVEEHAREIAASLDARGSGSRPRRAQGGRDEPGGDPGRDARGERRDDVRRRGRVDAHVLAGEDVDRRADRAAEAAAASAHAVQPRAAVGGDRHGLHEPEPVGARRPRVRVHRDADAPAPEDGRRPLAATRAVVRARSARGRARPAAGARRRSSGSPASATTCGRSRSPRATRSRRSSGSASRSTATASASSSGPMHEVADAEVDALCAEYEERYDLAPALARGRRAARVAARRGADRGGAARLPRRGRLQGASPTRSRISAACRSCRASPSQRLMADGYGFGAEGDWKTAALVRIAKVMGAGLDGGTLVHGGLHVRLRARRAGACSARTCSRSARRSRRAALVRDPPALDRRQGRPRAARLHRPRRPGRRRRARRPRRPLPAAR